MAPGLGELSEQNRAWEQVWSPSLMMKQSSGPNDLLKATRGARCKANP